MVVAVLGAFAGMVKVKYSSTAVDSHVFRLHYRWTTTFCFACCALVVAKEYIGDAIECISSGQANIKVATTYCWITSTFTINSTEPEFLRGVGFYSPKHHEQTFHSYYQWVSLVLFIQGCMFFVPHFLWQCYEGKQVDILLQDLNKGLFDEDSEKKKKNIVSYLKESWGLNVHYVSLYHVCECMNFINVMLQMYLMDRFLGGLFMDYGIRVFSLLDTDDRHDALATTFPRLTKCIFKKFGPSGTIQNIDLLCVLPQNIVNEKIFLVMWLWFIILAIITAAWLIWRLAVMSSISLRLRLLQHLSGQKLSDKAEQTIRSLHLGDFCILENMGYNLAILDYRDVLQGLTDGVEEFPMGDRINVGAYNRFHTPNGLETIPKNIYGTFKDTGL